MDKDFVYIISNSKGLIKVGISKNPTRRVKQLQTGNGEVLKLLFTEEFKCPRKKLLQIEDKIHKYLSNMCKKKTGEWFEITDTDLESIKNIITWHRIRYDITD